MLSQNSRLEVHICGKYENTGLHSGKIYRPTTQLILQQDSYWCMFLQGGDYTDLCVGWIEDENLLD